MFNKIPHINRRKLYLGLLGLDTAFFTLTDPGKIDSVFLIIGFVLIAVTLYLLMSRLFALGGTYGLRFDRRSRQMALFGTGVIITLLALQSIGELTLRDLLVSVPFGIVAYAYLSYGRNKHHFNSPNAV